MTAMSRRVAALALVVLGLAAHASAACDKTGTINIKMVTAGSANDPIAKCLSAMTLLVETDSGNCKVTLTPTAADGNFVNGIWGSSTVATNYYTVLQACPTTATVVTGAQSGTTSAVAAIEAAVNKAIYGTTVSGADVDTVAYAAGAVTLSRTTTDWVYAVITSTNTGDFAVASCSGSFTAGTHCVAAVSTNCPNGKFGVQIGSYKMCAVCPAGTYNSDGSGDGCMACDAGNHQSSVGQASCSSACAAGSYSEAGASDCQPCPAGYYAGSTGAGQCQACPTGTYSYAPGSTACLFCAEGIPKCQTGNGFTIGGSACSDADALNTAVDGYSVLTGTITNLKAGLTTYTSANSYAIPELFTTCSTPNLAVTVYADCSVDIAPVSDDSCSEPGATGYSYNDLVISGYMDGNGHIKTVLPTTSSGVSSSFLMIVSKTATAELTVSYLGATTDPANSGTFTATSTDDMPADAFTIWGQGMLDTTTAGTCPSGSYNAGSACIACSPGYSCDGADSTICTDDQYQPYVGGNLCTSCSSCRGTCTGNDYTTCTGGLCNGMTSSSGADYCTEPWYNTVCGDGTEFNAASRSCDNCQAGTAGTGGTCSACTAGTIAASAGLSTCGSCTGNTVAAVDGLSACETCPDGSIADGGHTTCTPCDPGQYSDGSACVPCPDGYYRTGAATPENNVCKPIPAGYRERATTSDLTGSNAAVAKSEIVPCEKGTYSSWDSDPTTPGSANRTPAASSSTTCQPCSGRFYAPRVGMQQCLPCKAGFVPSQSVSSNAIQGPDQCVSCLTAAGVYGYRDIFNNTNTCGTCAAGRETGPSKQAACTACRPGYYMSDDGSGRSSAEFCSACAQNSYSSTPGQTACTTCSAGYETFDDGNTACSKCAKGYYNPTGGQSCRAAPAGAFVNTTGATSYTPCGVGSFSNEKGSDWCDICPPGQYANVIGSKSCKTCPAGTYSGGGASTCKACAAGYYAPSGSSICSPCKAGTYTSTTKSATCSACPRGSQCPLLGTASPTPCKAGYYASKEGAKICTPCPVNTVTTATGSTTCTPCNAGYSTRGLTGQSKCQTVRPTLRRSMF